MTLGIINNPPSMTLYYLENFIYSVYITRSFCLVFVFILLLLCANQLAMECIGHKNLVCCNEHGSNSSL